MEHIEALAEYIKTFAYWHQIALFACGALFGYILHIIAFMLPSHTAIRVGTGVQYDDTVKQEARFRSMPMPKSLRRYLKKLYQHQQRMKELFEAKYYDNDYICKWDDGKPLAPDYVTQRFRLFLKQKGLRHITFHQLRHSSASLLINNGCTLREVQEWLGQASSKSTEIYAHMLHESKNGMADKINDALS